MFFECLYVKLKDVLVWRLFRDMFAFCGMFMRVFGNLCVCIDA